MTNKIDSQMLKGILYGCILLLLSKKEMYGYMISEELDIYGFKNISKGTIYPLLLSLEKKGLIIGDLKPSIYGPRRKYYSLTEKG
ncbi:TPA: PadR family transcriptional regulator, partial [Streptococcus pyogenes]